MTLQCLLKEKQAQRPQATVPTLRGLNEINSRQQQTQRTLLDWLRVEYAIEKPSNKLLAETALSAAPGQWV